MIQKDVSFDDFLKIDIRVGTIIWADLYPEARRPAIKLWIDFGPDIGEKKTSAQIAGNYLPEELPGKQVLGVVNFPPKQIGKFMSEILVLGIADARGDIVLVAPQEPVPNGGRLS